MMKMNNHPRRLLQQRIDRDGLTVPHAAQMLKCRPEVLSLILDGDYSPSQRLRHAIFLMFKIHPESWNVKPMNVGTGGFLRVGR